MRDGSLSAQLLSSLFYHAQKPPPKFALGIWPFTVMPGALLRLQILQLASMAAGSRDAVHVQRHGWIGQASKS